MNIEDLINSSEKVTSIYGQWPSFHDAKIKTLSIGTRYKVESRYTCETLEITIHCFEMTAKINEKGFYQLQKHNLITLYFEDIKNFELEGLSGQNELLSLNLKPLPVDERGFKFISVELEPAVGLGGYFEAIHVEVLRVEECDTNGKLTKS